MNHAPVQVLYNWRIEIRFQVGKRNSSYLYSHRIGHVVHSTAHPIGRGIPLTTLKWTDGRTDLRLVLRINGAAPPLQRISSVVMFNYMEVNDFFFSNSNRNNRTSVRNIRFSWKQIPIYIPLVNCIIFAWLWPLRLKHVVNCENGYYFYDNRELSDRSFVWYIKI